MVAVNAIGELSEVYSRVIRSRALVSVMGESSRFLTPSLKVSDTFGVMGTQLEASGGTKATVGAVESADVKITELAVIPLLDASSTVAPMET